MVYDSGQLYLNHQAVSLWWTPKISKDAILQNRNNHFFHAIMIFLDAQTDHQKVATLHFSVYSA